MMKSSFPWNSLLRHLAGEESLPEAGDGAMKRAAAMMKALPEALAQGPLRADRASEAAAVALFPKRAPVLATMRTSSAAFAMARSQSSLYSVYEAGGAQIQMILSMAETGGWVAAGKVSPPREGFAYTERCEPVALDDEGRFRLELGQERSVPIYLVAGQDRIGIPAHEDHGAG